MKQLFLFLIFVFSITLSSAEGWRPAEKQIVITINSTDEADQIASLKLSYDVIALNKIRAYVIPKELTQIELMGLNYEIEVEDLNKPNPNQQLTDVAYHSYQEIIDLADSLELNFPDICKKYIFGTSLGGRQLAALKISDNVEVDEAEAEVMFDGGIHGDEICGPENIIRFARDICIAYDTDPIVTDLIDNRETWLYLMVNPDGREAVPRVRYNNNGVDLNRDWAYMWDAWGGSPGPWSQVESKALRDCMYSNQFVVHTSYHGGTEYISLPWSYRSSQPFDWNHIYDLAEVYADVSGYPNLDFGQGNSGMYAINGSTKDANYGIMGSISWSMEISYDKQPPASQLMMYYDRNYPSMIAMMEYAGYGLEGIVTDANTGDPVQGVVFINNYYPTFTDPTAGDFHKYVLPGTYDITIVANGYESMTIEDIAVTVGMATTVDFELQPASGQFVYRFGPSQIPDNNEADEGLTPAVIGAPDNINYSIGKDGWCVLDMQYPVIDGPGFDFIVYEGDETPEGYTCYVSETIDGPWISLGDGSGTSEFDIANSSLPEAQFIKIMDDGDGSANVANAGFDLDGIEALEPVSGIYIAMYDYTIDDSEGNNNGRIDPGETVDIIVSLKNNGDIIAENTTGVISTSSVYITIDNETVSFGNLSQGQSNEGIYTITANAGTPQGEPVIIDLAVEASGGSYTNSFVLSFTVGLIVEDWETGNFEQYDWETGGSGDWAISTESPYEGSYCVKSGDINDNQITWLSISYDLIADGEIGFYKKVSSEGTYDFLKFYIDDNVMDQWSGEISWSETSFPVTAGNHTFKWTYEKDQSVSNGSDCAWIDFITLPAGALATIYAGFTSDETNICEEEIIGFTDSSLGNITSWDWIFEGGDPATSSSQNPMVAYFNDGSYDVTLTVSDGSNSNTLLLEDYITVMTTPETPTTPEGPDVVSSFPGDIDTYTTNEVLYANSYLWTIEPSEAGLLNENGMECSVDWTDYWVGVAKLKVKAMNNCGESDFSEDFDVDVVMTAVDNNIANSLHIFPNPNSGNFSIQLSDQLQGNPILKIINNLGKVVYKNNNLSTENGILQLNLSDLESGIYYLIINSDNTVLKEKIILQ